MKKVLIVGGSKSYYTPFMPWGESTDDVTLLYKSPQDIAFAVFTGGEDVSPSLYNEQKNYKTGSNFRRDEIERKVFLRLQELDIPKVGICRGSQFLCVMAGGKLVQHLDNHGGYHNLQTKDGRTILVTSTHHQMQLPPEGAVNIAWASPKLATIYEGPPGVNYEPEFEYDCVYYPNIKALGMQYHPEYMNADSDGFRYCQELTREYIGHPG